MPILKYPHQAPLPSQRQNGLVFATAADICHVIRCTILEFEEFAFSKNPQAVSLENAWVIDRYDLGDGILVPAILPSDVPDSYTPLFKGAAITVQSNPRSLKKSLVGQNVGMSGNQWAMYIKDRSGRNITPVVIKLLKDSLFNDGFYIPQPDLSENDTRVACGVFMVNLFDSTETNVLALEMENA